MIQRRLIPTYIFLATVSLVSVIPVLLDDAWLLQMTMLIFREVN